VTDRGFDHLSRALAQPRGRRSALKAIGATVGASVGAVLAKPFRADAACPAGTTPCGPRCCAGGVACLDASNGTCGCAVGYTACGTGCCKGTCTDPATSCCCESGTTPCGTACCQKGVSCYDAPTGICGCPSGTTPCAQNNILTCAPKGQSCDSGGPWPAPNTRVKNCVGCRRLMDSCSTNTDCCSNVCTPHKLGPACGCASDSDCPSSGAPYCDPKTGVCHS
jgi:hypothetical protein